MQPRNGEGGAYAYAYAYAYCKRCHAEAIEQRWTPERVLEAMPLLAPALPEAAILLRLITDARSVAGARPRHDCFRFVRPGEEFSAGLALPLLGVPGIGPRRRRALLAESETLGGCRRVLVLARIHRSGGLMRSKPAVGSGDGLVIGWIATLAGSNACEPRPRSGSKVFAGIDDRALPDELPSIVREDADAGQAAGSARMRASAAR